MLGLQLARVLSRQGLVAAASYAVISAGQGLEQKMKRETHRDWETKRLRVSISLLVSMSLLIWHCPSVLAEEERATGTIVGSVTIITNSLLSGQREQRAKDDEIIFLDGMKENNLVPSANITMSQKGKQFHPQILPIVVRATINFPNDDDIYHNVFSLSKTKPFDLGLYKAGDMSKSVTFDKTGRLKVYCNIHPQMIADILVLNNPYFTFTDKEGNYILSAVPPGNYKIRTWGRRTESVMKDVTITKGQVININFKLEERKYSTYHKNKYGKDYQSKY